jgi:ankyrin repeat protein
MKIYHLLIRKRADINLPTNMWSYTPLQAATLCGDIELAVNLLSRGARVNEEASYYIYYDNSWARALDIAARYGRLDMVKLLLNANALSGDVGSTGYDGALSLCKENHPAIADLIYQHIEERLRYDDMEHITEDPMDADIGDHGRFWGR